VVRPKALIDAINRDIGARSECVGLTVDVGRWEIAHRSGDCNWSEASLVVRVTGAVSPAAFVELRKAIARAQLRYDVFAPEAYLR
jgi:molybdopterin synthase catalytic subunit